MKRLTHKDGVVVRVFVWREGLAAAVGHDLEMEATHVEVDGDASPPRLVAAVAADSLKVLGAVKDGVTDRSAFNFVDRALIEKSTRGDVLDAKRHPAVRFASTSVTIDGDRARVAGDLTLRGTTRPIAFDAVRKDGRWTADVVVDQTAYGITPFTAFLGALKVKPNVLVRVSVPAVDAAS